MTTIKQVHSSHCNIDYLTDIFSQEVLLNVCSFLPPKELAKCGLVNSLFYQITSDPSLWQPLLNRYFRDSYKDYQLDPSISKKSLYGLFNAILRDNIWTGNYKLKSHQPNALPITSLLVAKDAIYFTQGGIVSLFKKKTDTKHSFKTGSTLPQIRIDEGHLYTNSKECIIALNLKTLKNHVRFSCDYQISCFTIHEDCFYTGLENNSIQSWDPTGKPLTTFKTREEPFFLKMNDDCLYAAVEKNILIWDTKSGKSIGAITTTSDVPNFYISDNCLYNLGPGRCVINVYNLAERKFQSEIKGTGPITAYFGYDRQLYVASSHERTRNNTLDVWNLNTQSIVKTLDTSQSTILCLTMHEGTLYTGDLRGKVQIYNFKTKKPN